MQTVELGTSQDSRSSWSAGMTRLQYSSVPSVDQVTLSLVLRSLGAESRLPQLTLRTGLGGTQHSESIMS